MQIRAAAILLLLWVHLLNAGEALPNLLTGWEKPAKGKVLLPHWRFSDWVRKSPRQSSGKKKGASSRGSVCSHRVEVVDGKIHLTLENPDTPYVSNMFFRTVSLPGNGEGLYRFSAAMVNGAKKKALVRITLTGTGNGRNYSARGYFSVFGELAARELQLALPKGCKTLQIIVTVLGPGKVCFSNLRLNVEQIAENSPPGLFCRETLSLPEKSPVQFYTALPPGAKKVPGNALLVTLPWGIRLLNVYGGELSHVKVKVREKTEMLISFDKRFAGIPGVTLLLGRDLADSGKTLMGSVQLLKGNEKGEPRYFEIKCVKDAPALAPRNFTVALSANGFLTAGESVSAFENALLRSGANVLVTPRQLLSLRQMHTARITQRAFLNAHGIPAEQHCYYSMLRDETFWEKYYLPLIRRNILRSGGRNVRAIMCDSYLGQRRAIHCLCSLCRVEFGDFASKLPKKDIMNCSAGLLEMRYGKELKAFRKARLKALWAGARLQLPVDARGFRSPPALIPVYQLSQVLSKRCHGMPGEAVIDLSTGSVLPDGIKYDPAVNFLRNTHLVQTFHKNNPPRVRLTGKFSPPLGAITPEELQFEMLNLIFCGFSGIWADLPATADYSYRAAFGEAAMLLREYEKFFRLPPLAKHPWVLQSSAAPLEVPPVPGQGGYPLELPREFPPLKLLVWKSGNRSLAAVGNFSSELLKCTLHHPGAPLVWRGKVEEEALSGSTLRSGISLMIPPRTWRFLEFDNL